ncbi:hypothetical protein J3R30DRAFT_685401 [Lentinula aciculospora]|uniref:Uncharacterized protein n=1 Tax=Lentinula aciculospora TaxID=153920 RepID=A0A9W9A4R8_9AGAR|nr:hypothetical protein J3R30DRAFT_685401 [Lentinula aciculospora]
MSSNCPPQLHLTLPANTTSFKRSFEQFGFDLEESPIAGGVESGSSAGNSASGSAGNGSTRIGNERKRARSASSSDGNESLRSSRSSTFTASSDTSFSENNDSLAQSSEPSSSRLVSSITPFVGPRPPRLPTPDIQDVQMPDYEQEEANDSTDNYRFTINEVHQSDHSRSPSHSRRSPTLPPTLPPLSLSEEEQPADMLFMRSSSTPSWSVDRLSRTISVSSSHREDPPMSGFDAPPRLPSPVYDLSPTLSAVIPDSDISSNIDNADNADVVDDEAPPVDAGRYVSFRERLNTAVGLLEADDVSAFRDRLTSALDAVRTDERDIDVEIDSHTLPHNARAPPAQTVPLSSRPWRTASNDMRSDAPAILSPRTRDLNLEYGPYILHHILLFHDLDPRFRDLSRHPGTQSTVFLPMKTDTIPLSAPVLHRLYLPIQHLSHCLHFDLISNLHHSQFQAHPLPVEHLPKLLFRTGV